MRLPRLRLKLWQWLVIVALVAVFLGGFEAHRMRLRSEEYHRKSISFALGANFEIALRKAEEQTAEETVKQFEAMERSYRESLSWELDPRHRGIDDGIFARRLVDDMIREARIAADRQAIKTFKELSESRREEMRQSVKLHKDRVRYFTQLSIKYEQAARSPWSAVEADPPEPH